MLSRSNIIFVALILGAAFLGAYIFENKYNKASKKITLHEDTTFSMQKELDWIDKICLVETENKKLASIFEQRNFTFGSEAWINNQMLLIEQLVYAGEFEKASYILSELQRRGAKGDYFNRVNANISLMKAKSLCSKKADVNEFLNLMSMSSESYKKLKEKTKNNSDEWLESITNSYLEQKNCEPIKLTDKLSEVPSYLIPRSKSRAGGVVTEDINNDGYIDFVLTSHSLDERIKVLTYNKENNNWGDMTESSGLSGLAGGLNLVQADYDNDGDIDLYISRGAWLSRNGEVPDSLLENDGEGFFTDVTKQLGLYSQSPSQVATWQDYDGDGLLDLFVGNETSVFGTREDKEKNLQEEQVSYPNRLYKNMGSGGFKDVARELGLADIGFTKGASWGDFNADGLVDLYVSFFGGDNSLYIHYVINGKHRFIDEAKKYQVDKPIMSFPVFVLDYNHDGYDDIYVANFRTDIEHEIAGLWGEKTGPVGRLYENLHGKAFKDVTSQVGLDIPMSVMGGNFGDIDNDGYFDLYLGTGSPSIEHLVPNRFFKYEVGVGYKELTNEYGLGLIDKGHGIAFTDLDNDGDQDIYASMGGWYEVDSSNDKVFFNNNTNENDWVTLKLERSGGNKGAIGSKVEIKIIDFNGVKKSYYHTVSSGGSFGSGSLQIESGLGQIKKIESIVVTWPNRMGSKEVFYGIEKNKLSTIVEGEGTVLEQKSL